MTSDDAWTRCAGGRVIHRDTDVHARLVARTLDLSPTTWARVLDDYAERWSVDRDDATGRLATLREAFAATEPAAPFPPSAEVTRCPLCATGSLFPGVTRRNSDAPELSSWGRCHACRHLALVAGAAPPDVYRDASYYRARNPGGSGYAAYLDERVYREDKGARLLDRVADLAGAMPKAMLEVGSGFGFTRRAAEVRCVATAGVDVNPHAATEAQRLYGLPTFTGSLADSLVTPGSGVAPGAFDVVLFQFVLEHLTDPVGELRAARRALRPGGAVAVLVPSSEATELDVFGGHYRSLRRDHLHLFSHASLDNAFTAAGLSPRAHETQCSLDLFAGFLAPDDLARLYAAGTGPDLLGIAVRGDRP